MLHFVESLHCNVASESVNLDAGKKIICAIRWGLLPADARLAAVYVIGSYQCECQEILAKAEF